MEVNNNSNNDKFICEVTTNFQLDRDVILKEEKNFVEEENDLSWNVEDFVLRLSDDESECNDDEYFKADSTAFRHENKPDEDDDKNSVTGQKIENYKYDELTKNSVVKLTPDESLNMKAEKVNGKLRCESLQINNPIDDYFNEIDEYSNKTPKSRDKIENDFLETFVNLHDMINQLMNVKVVLEKLPTSLVSKTRETKIDNSTIVRTKSKRYMHFCSKCRKIPKKLIKRNGICEYCGGSIVFQCTQGCDMYFPTYYIVLNHIQKYCNLQNFFCANCEYSTVTKSSLYLHYKKMHVAQNEPMADYTNFLFFTRENGTFRCSKCSYEDINKATLTDHIKQEHSEGKNAQDAQLASIFKRTSRKQSIKESEAIKEKIKANSRKSLKTSLNSTKNGKNFKESFAKLFNTSKMVKYSDADLQKLIKTYCPECKKPRPNPKNGALKCWKCKNALIYSCAKCDVEFATNKASAWQHAAKHQSQDSSSQGYECAKCGKKFSRPQNQKMHEKYCNSTSQ